MTRRRKQPRLMTMRRLSRLRKSFFTQYRVKESVKYGVTFCWAICQRIMWVDVPLALSSPERIFFVRLNPTICHGEMNTSLGKLSIPEYTTHTLIHAGPAWAGSLLNRLL